ncbi:two-component system sensor histidine kinase CreC [Luteolibacter ambystomatis]|uniref:histidine kinase n=1 Tax=Luteolibacter ambystomatis TaxID=2824561 RepID=A0A975G8I4_9BACT|nr:two-component system sensor histidine kinase CreC [Luteolibacter ambystomatis]QUE50928.1 two-component system sensor histidine kinase CreC [Luteolibacter ambystomatis]
MRFTRVTLFFIGFIMVLGFYQLATYFLSGVEPQTFQATEEVMVDSAHLLAELVENEMEHGKLDTDHLREVFDGAHERTFVATIFEHTKHNVGTNVYLTDALGRVIFDSEGGKREGQDYSKRRDVALTLRGEYGARSSRNDQADSNSSILYVAAPVGDPAHPSGVLTVFKPQADALPMIKERKQVIYRAFILIGGGTLFLITVVFLWLYRPIGKITEYARAIERGERPKRPKIGIGREVNTLSHALESMREALEGRAYVEHYIQTLTHEMKSPLAAIRGAAELLDEDMPAETRHRFLENIRAESARTERLINRLLELSAIESKVRLDSAETLDLNQVVAQAIDQAKPLAELAGVRLDWSPPEEAIPVRGDAFILRAAVTNLLENAIDFSPDESVVKINTTISDHRVSLTIRDHGPGIPDYAQERIFDRFYSLRHHTMGRKGTGLGLTLVREAAELHGGLITLEPAEEGGTTATFSLPLV